MDPRRGELAATGARLSALHETLGFDVGMPPGDGWVFLDEVDRASVAGWVDERAEALGGHRATAAADVSRWLVYRIVVVAIACLVTERRVVDLGTTNVALHRDGTGRIDRALLRDGTCTPVGEAPSPGLGRLADQLTATLTPPLDAIRGAAPFGWRGLWGNVADSAAATLIRLTSVGALESSVALAAWPEISGILDGMVELGAPVITRPRLFLDGDGRLAWVRGICCLHFSLPSAVERAGGPWCGTCPLPARRNHDPSISPSAPR